MMGGTKRFSFIEGDSMSDSQQTFSPNCKLQKQCNKPKNTLSKEDIGHHTFFKMMTAMDTSTGTCDYQQINTLTMKHSDSLCRCHSCGHSIHTITHSSFPSNPYIYSNVKQSLLSTFFSPQKTLTPVRHSDVNTPEFHHPSEHIQSNNTDPSSLPITLCSRCHNTLCFSCFKEAENVRCEKCSHNQICRLCLFPIYSPEESEPWYCCLDCSST